MTTLFTIHKSWHDRTFLYEQLAYASRGDSILLIEDAVLAIAAPVTLASFVAKCDAQGIRVFALQNDATLRGIGAPLAQIGMVDYEGFVALVVEHDKQVAW